MRRRVACRWLGVLLLGAGRAAVAGDGPQPLSGPSLTGPSVSPAPSGDTAGLPPAAAENRPMLVIPGVNVPGRVRARSAPLPPLEPAGADDGPQLFGPSSLTPPVSTPALTPAIASPAPAPASARPTAPSAATVPPFRALGRPLPLESVSDPAATDSRPGERLAPLAAKPGTTAESHPAPAVPPRPSSRFSRFLPSPFSAGRVDNDRSAITVEPSTDPASEAALKRRIERQIHESLGDRVHDVEVRVVGPEVTIRAKATRFWQRRTVRRTLESLPGLAGYRHTVEILD